MMGYFIDARGKRIMLGGLTHEQHAKIVMKSDLKKVLKTHVRVAIYKDRFCLETSRRVLSAKEKHTLNLIYREHHCRGYGSRIGDKFYESDHCKTIHRINYHKCMGKY